MLLNDIDDNRFRVQAIFRRLNEAVDESLVLNQLVREQLLSPEQYEQLKTDSDLNTIADVIKNTKVVLPKKTKIKLLIQYCCGGLLGTIISKWTIR